MGSSWFSSEEGKKGSIVPGQLADLAVLSADYFSIPEEEIKRLESVLTIVGGKVVYAAAPFEARAAAVAGLAGLVAGCTPTAVYAQHKTQDASAESNLPPAIKRSDTALNSKTSRWLLGESGLWSLDCDCFAF